VKLRRALITAAGRDDQALPLQRLIDRDGRPKTALEILVEEALSAGAHEIAIVVRPGEETAYRAAAGKAPSRLELIPQDEPRGYGHALKLGRGFVAGEPFLHLVGDHLAVSDLVEPAADAAEAGPSCRRCAEQLVAVAEEHDCAISAVQSTREHMLPFFGTIGGHRVAGSRGLYEVETVVEKPTPTQAEQDLVVPGLRAGHYLCFFGMHVLTPGVFDLLDALGPMGDRLLSPALAALAGREKYLAYEVQGRRYDLGDTYGLLVAQLALGLAGRDRGEILARLVELLARGQGT